MSALKIEKSGAATMLWYALTHGGRCRGWKRPHGPDQAGGALHGMGFLRPIAEHDAGIEYELTPAGREAAEALA